MTHDQPSQPVPSRKFFLRLLFWFTAMCAAYFVLLRPYLLRWGTQGDAAKRPMIGDNLILHPHLRMTLGVEIDAPPEVVWLWLAQMGREGTGFYAFDQFSSAQTLRHDLPKIGVGMTLDNGLKVLTVETARALVVGQFGGLSFLNMPYDVSCAYLLEKHTQHNTRLLCRVRLFTYGLSGLVLPFVLEPLVFAYLAVQLHNLRRRAEASKQHVVFSKEKSNGNIHILLKN